MINCRNVHAETYTDFYSIPLSPVSSGSVTSNSAGNRYYILNSYTPDLDTSVISIPDSAYNIKVSFRYIAPIASFTLNSATSNVFYTYGIFRVNTGNVQWSNGQNFQNSTFPRPTNSDVLDVTNLFHTGDNTIQYVMTYYSTTSVSASSWTFSGSNMGNIQIIVTYDYDIPLPPSPSPVPEPSKPGNNSYPSAPSSTSLPSGSTSYNSVTWFIDTNQSLSSAGFTSSNFNYKSLGSFPVNSPNGSKSAIYLITGKGDMAGVVVLARGSSAASPIGYFQSGIYNDMSSVFNQISSISTNIGYLSSALFTYQKQNVDMFNKIQTQIYNLSVSMSVMQDTLNQIEYTGQVINDNIENAHGANSDLNNSNSEVDSALQDYKDKTDTSAQYDQIDDSLFDFDSSIFVQYATTLTFFSSVVTLLWASLGEFSTALTIFLVLVLISAIIGIYRYFTGGK